MKHVTDKKDRCQTGKPCGKSCIHRFLKCRKELADQLSDDLGKVASANSSPSRDIKSIIRVGEKFTNGNQRLRVIASIARKFDLYDQRVREKMLDPTVANWNKELLMESYQKALKVRARALEKAEKEMEKIRSEMLRTNLSEKLIKTTLDKINFVNTGSSSTIRSYAEEFMRMFNGKGFLRNAYTGPGIIPMSVKTIEKTDGRANARVMTGMIRTNDTKRTLFHEVAHIVERQSPELLAFTKRWVRGRAFNESQAYNYLVSRGIDAVPKAKDSSTGGLPLYLLRDLRPAGQYKDTEFAYVDRFMTTYMGKHYRNRSTEVLSIATESFSDPKRMSALFFAHPDLFHLVAGLTQS